MVVPTEQLCSNGEIDTDILGSLTIKLFWMAVGRGSKRIELLLLWSMVGVVKRFELKVSASCESKWHKHCRWGGVGLHKRRGRYCSKRRLFWSMRNDENSGRTAPAYL